MKRKGFTLVELLAVIVILSVIAIITIPIIGNVIEESKKKALEQSVHGLVESANYYSINNEGTYEFLFDENHKGETIKGESLDYNGLLEAEGKLYLDDEGNISICVYNDKYYAYKNYNSGIVVGNRKEDNCNIGYDVISNKYVAFLESEGMSSNVYSKEEVNNIIDGVENKIAVNTNEITNMKETITELQSNLSNYALQSSLDTTNSNLDSLSSIVSNNQSSINELKNKLAPQNGTYDITMTFGNLQASVYTYSNTAFIGDMSNKNISISNVCVQGVVCLSSDEILLLSEYLRKNKLGFGFSLANQKDPAVVDLAKKIAGYSLTMKITITDD